MTALTAALKCDPTDSRMHSRLAQVLCEAFDQIQSVSENAIGLELIRDAAMTSEFPSRAALNAWLDRAVGKPRRYLTAALAHARRAVQLCPLDGQAYIQLAELCFVENVVAQTKADFVLQALAVRPHNGHVLFAAGKEAMLVGDAEKGLEFWMLAFQREPAHRREVLAVFAGRIPVANIIELFHPDWQGLGELVHLYRKMQRPQELQATLGLFAKALVEHADGKGGSTASGLLLTAAEAYGEQQDFANKTACLRKALDCDSDDIGVRKSLGVWCLATKDFAEAEEHLNYCLQRQPDDPELRQLADTALTEKLRSPIPHSLNQLGARPVSRQ